MMVPELHKPDTAEALLEVAVKMLEGMLEGLDPVDDEWWEIQRFLERVERWKAQEEGENEDEV